MQTCERLATVPYQRTHDIGDRDHWRLFLGSALSEEANAPMSTAVIEIPTRGDELDAGRHGIRCRERIA